MLLRFDGLGIAGVREFDFAAAPLGRFFGSRREAETIAQTGARERASRRQRIRRGWLFVPALARCQAPVNATISAGPAASGR